MNIEFKTRILTQAAELRGVAAEWSDLCNRCSNATPFQRPEWVISWAETFSPENIRAVEVRSANKLVGLAPFLIYPRDTERVLAFMAGGISDYLDILVDPNYESQAVPIIFRALHKMDQWTTLDLTDLPANSVLRRTMPTQLATEHDHCSSIPLPISPDEFLQHLSKRQRANLRQASSRIQRAGGARFERATGETLTEFLEDLFRLHGMRWLREGQPGVLADEMVKAFHHKAAPGLLARGILRLYRLRLKEQTLAVVYAFFSRATVFCYLQGYDPEFASLSPGTHLIFSVIKDAISSGINKFDMLRGEEAYKQHWRAQSEATHRIQFSRLFTNTSTQLDSAAA
jgi:CelD/BcsL family acetyltransferase involved in cellulose biosynthesis